MEHKGDRILQVCSMKWELGNHGAHACVHMCGVVFTPTHLWLLLHACAFLGVKSTLCSFLIAWGKLLKAVVGIKQLWAIWMFLTLAVDFCLPVFDFYSEGRINWSEESIGSNHMSYTIRKYILPILCDWMPWPSVFQQFKKTHLA